MADRTNLKLATEKLEAKTASYLAKIAKKKNDVSRLEYQQRHLLGSLKNALPTLKDVSSDEVIQMCREGSADIFGTPDHKEAPTEQSLKATKNDVSGKKRNAKSSLFRLPAFVQVHEITGLEHCEKLLESALAGVSQGEKDVMVVGLDTEWGEGSRVTLLQIAFEKYCFLIRMQNLRRELKQKNQDSKTKQGWPPSLVRLLSDSQYVLTGSAVRFDLQLLHNQFGLASSQIVDLQHVATRHGFHKPHGKGLAGMTKTLLHRELAKDNDIRCGDWAATSFSADQLHYAAADAVVAPLLLRRMHELVALKAPEQPQVDRYHYDDRAVLAWCNSCVSGSVSEWCDQEKKEREATRQRKEKQREKQFKRFGGGKKKIKTVVTGNALLAQQMQLHSKKAALIAESRALDDYPGLTSLSSMSGVRVRASTHASYWRGFNDPRYPSRPFMPEHAVLEPHARDWHYCMDWRAEKLFGSYTVPPHMLLAPVTERGPTIKPQHTTSTDEQTSSTPPLGDMVEASSPPPLGDTVEASSTPPLGDNVEISSTPRFGDTVEDDDQEKQTTVSESSEDYYWEVHTAKGWMQFIPEHERLLEEAYQRGVDSVYLEIPTQTTPQGQLHKLILGQMYRVFIWSRINSMVQKNLTSGFERQVKRIIRPTKAQAAMFKGDLKFRDLKFRSLKKKVPCTAVTAAAFCHWIEVEFPVPVCLSAYSVRATSSFALRSNAPRAWVLSGSEHLSDERLLCYAQRKSLPYAYEATGFANVKHTFVSSTIRGFTALHAVGVPHASETSSLHSPTPEWTFDAQFKPGEVPSSEHVFAVPEAEDGKEKFFRRFRFTFYDPESDRPFSVNVSQLRLWGHPLGVQHPQTPLLVASDTIESRGVGVFTLDEQAMRFTTITADRYATRSRKSLSIYSPSPHLVLTSPPLTTSLHSDVHFEGPDSGRNNNGEEISKLCWYTGSFGTKDKTKTRKPKRGAANDGDDAIPTKTDEPSTWLQLSLPSAVVPCGVRLHLLPRPLRKSDRDMICSIQGCVDPVGGDDWTTLASVSVKDILTDPKTDSLSLWMSLNASHGLQQPQWMHDPQSHGTQYPLWINLPRSASRDAIGYKHIRLRFARCQQVAMQCLELRCRLPQHPQMQVALLLTRALWEIISDLREQRRAVIIRRIVCFLYGECA